jgi:hypothetical protein
MEHKSAQTSSDGYSYSDVNIREQYDTTNLYAILGRFADAVSWRDS